METYSVFGQLVMTFDLEYDEALITKTVNDWKNKPDLMGFSTLTLPRDKKYPLKVHLQKGITSYQPQVDFLEEAKLIKLKENFEKCCDVYTEKANLDEVVIINSWFNILYQGGELDFHHHGYEDLAGAYYFKTNKESAPLVFEKTGEESVKLYPQNGRLVIFPGGMRHGIELNQSVERGTISFNARTKKIVALFQWNAR